MTRQVVAALALWLGLARGSGAGDAAFAAGESMTFRITYLHMLAGRAWLRVERAEGQGPQIRFAEGAKSQGFFAWLFRFKVDDRAVAEWDPATGCSLGIEKHLREGKAVREQIVRIDPAAGIATVQDPKIKEGRFDVEPCTLDVLSAFFVARLRGVTEARPLSLPVFDNGKQYHLGVRVVGRATLDLPPPFGKTVTVIVEPQLLDTPGLFVKEGRLRIWLTDDARRIPVRMQSRVPIGSVNAELESYEAGG